MDINRTTVPGQGVLHHIVTRAGEHLCLLVDAGTRRVLIYDESDLDVPARSIALEPDEADQVAEILQSRPIADRLASLERQVNELIGERGR
ncbi:hypothetical protein [Rhodococcus sp. NPDC058514]|uniref:hypothetical protein n=1 Tax=unclassified Rhodococcus (in: high G+C Gram-positive bacteria) TaxID=192944 RepID=UPI00364B1FF9